MLSVRVVFTVLIWLLISAPVRGAQSCSPPLVVVEQDGRVSAGSKQRLRAAVQVGLPLRVRSTWCIDPRVSSESLPTSMLDEKSGK
jgi:hypothetical protein